MDSTTLNIHRPSQLFAVTRTGKLDLHYRLFQTRNCLLTILIIFSSKWRPDRSYSY